MVKAHILIVEDDKGNKKSDFYRPGDGRLRLFPGGKRLPGYSGRRFRQTGHCPAGFGASGSGWRQVIEKIRTWSQMPIIVISARSEDRDKIEALDAGADDYLTKPFSIDELRARLRVTLRRLNVLKTRIRKVISSPMAP